MKPLHTTVVDSAAFSCSLLGKVAVVKHHATESHLTISGLAITFIASNEWVCAEAQNDYAFEQLRKLAPDLDYPIGKTASYRRAYVNKGPAFEFFEHSRDISSYAHRAYVLHTALAGRLIQPTLPLIKDTEKGDLLKYEEGGTGHIAPNSNKEKVLEFIKTHGWVMKELVDYEMGWDTKDYLRSLALGDHIKRFDVGSLDQPTR